ncbi:MAG: hypothetical protein AAFV53_01420 [Myxococcota bacterium]
MVDLAEYAVLVEAFLALMCPPAGMRSLAMAKTRGAAGFRDVSVWGWS